MAVIDFDPTTEHSRDLVGPIIRSGELADAIIDAVEEDNPDTDVLVVDRDSYVRIHTVGRCRLTRVSLEKYLGRPFPLVDLEIDMPSWKGHISTGVNEYIFSYPGYEQEQS
ncbi:MAG: MmoB/DmpM family protein [Mycobacterium sp.]